MLLFVISASVLTMEKVMNKEVYLLCEEDELAKLLQVTYPSHLMIDLREKEDYEKGHIKEFINIPSSEGKEVVGYIQANNLKNKSIYLICYSGKRAAKAINLLRSKGCRKLVYITFGYEKYANSQEDFVPKVGRCDCLAD